MATGGWGNIQLPIVVLGGFTWSNVIKCDQFGRWWRYICCWYLLILYTKEWLGRKKDQASKSKRKTYKAPWSNLQLEKYEKHQTIIKNEPSSPDSERIFTQFRVDRGLALWNIPSGQWLQSFAQWKRLVGQVSPSGLRMLSDKTQRKKCLKPRKTEPWRKTKQL